MWALCCTKQPYCELCSWAGRGALDPILALDTELLKLVKPCDIHPPSRRGDSVTDKGVHTGHNPSISVAMLGTYQGGMRSRSWNQPTESRHLKARESICSWVVNTRDMGNINCYERHEKLGMSHARAPQVNHCIEKEPLVRPLRAPCLTSNFFMLSMHKIA